MDLTHIQSLINLIADTNVAELEITQGEGENASKVRITMQQQQQQPLVATIAAPVPQYAPPIQPMPAESLHPKENKASDETIKGHAMKSPMVGTVYLSPSPDAEPFVRTGQHVEAGDIVCIVEAMKMFNQIEADVSGIITGRLIENGQPVEYGQTLFIIE